MGWVARNAESTAQFNLTFWTACVTIHTLFNFTGARDA